MHALIVHARQGITLIKTEALNSRRGIMALITCKECGKVYSSKAKACINCGFPTSENVKVNNDIDILSDFEIEKESKNISNINSPNFNDDKKILVNFEDEDIDLAKKSKGKIMRKIPMVICVISGLWALLIELAYIHMAFGIVGVFLGLVVFPAIFALMPFYIAFVFGNWSPLFLGIFSTIMLMISGQIND
jgi:ribosomal protein L37E